MPITHVVCLVLILRRFWCWASQLGLARPYVSQLSCHTEFEACWGPISIEVRCLMNQFGRIAWGFPSWTPFLRIVVRSTKNCESQIRADSRESLERCENRLVEVSDFFFCLGEGNGESEAPGEGDDFQWSEAPGEGDDFHWKSQGGGGFCRAGCLWELGRGVNFFFFRGRNSHQVRLVLRIKSRESVRANRPDSRCESRPPDYSSNLCRPQIWSIWLFQGVFLGLLYKKKKGSRPKTPPKKVV